VDGNMILILYGLILNPALSIVFVKCGATSNEPADRARTPKANAIYIPWRGQKGTPGEATCGGRFHRPLS
jgi:hypothetical protein